MLLSPKGRLARLCVSLCVAACSMGLHAQSTVTPEDEYRKLIRVDEDIHPLGENPFGESVSVYNGTLSFDQSDLNLGGNGPAIQVERSFHLRELKESESIDGAFSDWELELPRITTVTANQTNVTGWQVRNSADADARCSHFGAPPTVMAQQGGSDWEPHSWWAGYQLVVPGQGSQDLLKRVAENTETPQMSGMNFSIVTKDHWMVSCLDATDGSAPGEAFLAVAPDGTKYWFTHMVYRWASTIHRPIGSNPLGQALPRLHADPRLMVASTGDILPQALSQIMAAMPALAMDDFLRRRTASLLVTRVQDRFGNTLTYSYVGDNLTAITASDGRQVVFGYEAGTNRVTSVTLQPASGSPRMWSYQYNSDARHTLNRVVLPDGSAWSYQLSDFLYGEIDTTEGTCDGAALISDAVQAGTITHPSGLVGSFQVKPIVRGRSYVLKQCITTSDDPTGYALVPRTYTQYSILSKTFSGAGVPTRTWQYAYSPSNESWSSDCTSGCVSTVFTDVTSPDGAATRYTFSNRFDVSEGQLLRTDFYSGAPGTTVLRSVVNTYAPSTAGPWPSRYGSNLQSRMNAAVIEQAAPLSKRVTTQDSTNYTWEAEAFNAYAQVTQARRYSSIAGQASMQEQTDYLNDPVLWVLGLPTQVTNLSSGEVVDRNVYDPGNDTLAERWHFGQKLMTYAFNAQGQLASFTDGNTHITTLSNYKRGIPQTVGYPDSTSQTLVVDDFGQIRSITDQAGATTSYSYDAIGRLARIDYPSGDEQAWYTKTFTYDFVTGAERGVGANHWRRTIAKGNQRQVTYFNAELQPVLTDTYINGDANSHSNLRSDYDYRGLATFSSYPAAGQPGLTDLTAGITSTYDALGRLTRTQQASELGTLTTTIAYQPGARKQVTDPKFKVTTTSYQVFDQPSYDTVIEVAAPTGLIQTIARDLYGHPLSITQAGPFGTGTVSLTKTLTYDAFHRLCRTTEPESGSEVMAYDGANNLVWSATGLSLTGSDCGLDQVADAGKTVRTYDAMNRLWTLAPPAGTQSTTYGYDLVGNPKSAISGMTTWSATRNKLGQLTGETLQVTGQDPWHVAYSHDAYGNLKQLTYPDGEILDYAPDALGRPTQVGRYASGVLYFPNGEVASFGYGNGASYLAEQNARQLLSNFSYGAGGALSLSEDYSYDANGNITNVTDLVDGHRTKAFGYDDLNRLTSATASNLWGTEGYTYDPLNNIRTRVGNGATYTYNYDALNHLANISGAGNGSFGYDNRGNVTSKNGSTLQFDQKNQLTQIDGLASYAYDAAGRRVLKTTAGGASTYYFYNQAGQLLQSYDAVGNLVTSYMRLGSTLVAKSSLLLVVPDALTTISAPSTAGASFQVSWSESQNAANYVLEQSKDGGAWTLTYQGLSTSLALYPTANGNYLFRVKACNVKGCSSYTQSGTVEVTLPPTAAPTVSVPASTNSGNYSVNWNAVAAATSYTLQTQVNGGAWAISQQGSALSRAVSDAGNGTYGYRVRAENKGGYGPWSGVASIDVKRIPVAPAAPSISVGGNAWKPVFTVSWNAIPWATSYQAEEVGQDTITFYDGPNTSGSIMVLDEGMVQFHVRACSAYGCSPWSAYTSHGGSAPTGTPTISVPTGSSTGSYTVSWTSVSMASSYKLQEQVNGGTWTSITNTASTSTTLSGKPNGQYGYRVMACNANGCGPVSASKTITVGISPATPAAPHVSVSGVDYKQVVKASWTAVAGATSYNVEVTEPGATAGEVYGNGANTIFSTVTFDPGTYKFRVQACNSVGCSGWSAYGSANVVSGL